MDQILAAKENTEINSSISLGNFEHALEAYKNKLSSSKNVKELRIILLNDASNLIDHYLSVGDQAAVEQHVDMKAQEIVDNYLINYKIPEILKSVFVLHRNVLLEFNKAAIMRDEEVIKPELEEKHLSDSKNVLIEALEELGRNIPAERKLLLKKKNIKKVLLQKMKLHHNPWKVYHEQLKTIQDQLQLLNRSLIELFRTSTRFKNIKNIIKKVIDKNEKHYKNYHDLIVQIESILKEEKPDQLLSLLDKNLIEEGIGTNNLEIFTNDLIFQVEQLEKIEIPIALKDGLLQVREVNLNKSVQKWLDYEVLKEFMDLFSLEESLHNKFKLSTTNLKNNLQLSKNVEGNMDYISIKNSFEQLKSEFQKAKSNSAKILAKIDREMNDQFFVTNLFKNSPFLDVAIQSSINLGGSTMIKDMKGRMKNILSYFNNQYKKSNYRDSFSNVELASQCITYRMLAKEDENYDMLFLSKNFIGDIFLVPRLFQEQQLKETIDHWNQGFNKAVLIEGDRLSGKSTFLDYTSKKYFGKDIVTLKPDSTAVIDGRKFKTTKNLKEALQYVKNNKNKNTRPLVLMDDLELWVDSTHHFLNNVRSLIEFIENESDEIFVLVATTNSMVASLDNRLGFSKIFSSVINLNITDKQEVLKAFVLRHGASHKSLVTKELDPISDRKMQRIIYKLSHQNQDNIGVVLQAWTYNTTIKDEEKVMYKEIEHEFIDFFSMEELIILKQASIFKMVSELGMKSATAHKYETNFKSPLKRLINMRVLLRNKLGNLYINPVILHEVGIILKSKGLVN